MEEFHECSRMLCLKMVHNSTLSVGLSMTTVMRTLSSKKSSGRSSASANRGNSNFPTPRAAWLRDTKWTDRDDCYRGLTSIAAQPHENRVVWLARHSRLS